MDGYWELGVVQSGQVVRVLEVCQFVYACIVLDSTISLELDFQGRSFNGSCCLQATSLYTP
jgi:hypothetical protein